MLFHVVCVTCVFVYHYVLQNASAQHSVTITISASFLKLKHTGNKNLGHAISYTLTVTVAAAVVVYSKHSLLKLDKNVVCVVYSSLLLAY